MQTVFDLRKIKRQFEKGVHKMKGWTKLWHCFAKAKMGMKIRIAFLAMMLIGMTGWGLFSQMSKQANLPFQTIQIKRYKKDRKRVYDPFEPPASLKKVIEMELNKIGFFAKYQDGSWKPKYYRQLKTIEVLKKKMNYWEYKIVALGIAGNLLAAKEKFTNYVWFRRDIIKQITKNQSRKNLSNSKYLERRKNLEAKLQFTKSYISVLKRLMEKNV